MSTQSQQDVTIPSARANAVEATDDRPKILLGTMNHADMPMSITRALKRKGYTAEHIQYTTGKGHALRYELDNEVDVLKFGGRIAAQTATLKDCLEREFDIFHFWNRSLFYSTNYSALTGFDIPLLKSRGRKIVFRFTGFDLRLRRGTAKSIVTAHSITAIAISSTKSTRKPSSISSRTMPTGLWCKTRKWRSSVPRRRLFRAL